LVTLTDLADIDYPKNNPLERVSLKPLLLKENAKLKDRLIFNHWKGLASVRSHKCRLDDQKKLM